MTDTAAAVAGGDDSKDSEAVNKAKWPLDFQLQLPKQQRGQPSLHAFGFDASKPVKKCWWSHKLYRGPHNKPVQILYSKTKQDSEKIACQFLDEAVVGFDMEWPWNDYKKSELQNKIGLIQIASEDKIGLIHIGLHPGKTVDDIIAPSLRKLIESPEIGKLGVGILSADFARLRRFFKLNPKGAVELSHMYRLIKFGGWKPELVSTKLVSLARLVEDQLGHPLYKGDVRTSNWSKPLSQDQINYAAGDAYAGYQLYHCMNYKRLQMKRVPPLPIHAERYLEFKLSGINALRLDVQNEDGTMMSSETFYGVTMSDSARSSTSKTKEKDKKPQPAKMPKELADPASQALYNELHLRRASLAEKAGLSVYRITTDAVLVALALKRPVDSKGLLAVKGIGPKQQEAYGKVWLAVIAQFLDPNGAVAAITDPTTTTSADDAQHAAQEPPSTPVRPPRRRQNEGRDTPDSSPAFGTPKPRTPVLHTGLSFTLAETNLGAEDSDDGAASDASTESLPDLDFDTPSTNQTPHLKRKRIESPTKSTLTASQRLQQLTQAAPPPPTTPAKPIPQLHFAPLTPRSRISRNKLLAFSKLVTRNIPGRSPGAPPIVSERTLSLIVVRAPQTLDELEKIPGIDSFVLACQQTGTDLLRNVVKFTGGRGSGKV
jgi:ribonuclease D